LTYEVYFHTSAISPGNTGIQVKFVYKGHHQVKVTHSENAPSNIIFFVFCTIQHGWLCHTTDLPLYDDDKDPTQRLDI